MNYGDIKRPDTVVTENEYFENKIGVGAKTDIDAEAAAESEPREKKKRIFNAPRFPRPNFAFFKTLKAKFDVYDAIMIPVGAGIVAAFVMLIIKIA